MTKNYEYTYLTRQDMTEEAAKTLQEKIARLITAKNGAIIDTPRSYKKRLAYRIKKQDVAFVNAVMFTLDADKLAAFKKDTDEISEILRGLIVSYDPKKLEAEARREPRITDEKGEETVIVMKEIVRTPAVKTEKDKLENRRLLLRRKKERKKKKRKKNLPRRKRRSRNKRTQEIKKGR